MRLLIAAQEEAKLIVDAVEACGGEVVGLVERSVDIGLAARTHTVDAVLVDADLVEMEELQRLASQSTCAVVAWLRHSSSERTGALLEVGTDEVLHPGMVNREARARLRRAVLLQGRRTAAGPLEFAGLTLDDPHGEATWNGRDLRLTRRERQVLTALAAAAGKPVRREALYREVWGYAMARGDRSVDVNVKRLRAKLASSGSGIAVRTQPGVGYRLEIVSEPVEAVTAS